MPRLSSALSAATIATTALPPTVTRRADQIPTARGLARRYGTATAARYLRKRGWSVDAALFILAGHWPFAGRNGATDRRARA